MKRILFVAFLLLFTGAGAFAQNLAIAKAENALTKGELDKAKESIDAAAQHEKTKNKSKMYLVRAKVYQSIFLDSGKYKNLSDNAAAVAIESYNKAKDLEGKKAEVTVKPQMQGFYNNVLNVGADAYKVSDFKKAEDYFKVASEIMPEDTTALLYLGVAASQAKDYPTAKSAYNALLSKGYKKSDIYSNLIYIARNVDKDENKALELVREAKALFPNEKTYAQEELNILIATNKIEEAKKNIEETLAKEPNNANLYYNLGFMYDQTKNTDKAIENYKKAIEINPNYFEAYFNTGVVYYNKAADLLKEVNAMDLKTYQKVGKQKEEQGLALLKESLPYFEKAHSLNAEDMAVVETLQTIYSRLKRDADADNMKKILDAHNK